MKVGSLFSGIGGFGLGLGMPVAWQVEKDSQCLRVLAHHWPTVERINDVRKAGCHNLKPVDLICGGFPCQDLSVAGKRAGLDGERSGLWFGFLRIIGELRPCWVLIENVPGLLSSHKGSDFLTILQGLAQLGYYAAWRVLDSQYFGVPQRRRRVFIVASLGNGRCAEVLFEPTCLCGNPPPSREARESLTQNTASSLSAWGGKQRSHNERSSHGWSQERQPCLSGGQDHNLVAFGGNNTAHPINTATACNAHGGTGRHDFESETFVVTPPLTGNPYGDHESREGLLTVAFAERTRPNGRNIETQTELAYAVDNPASGGSAHCRNISYAGGVRRLTPTECLRLQGFPNNWLDIDPPLSDSAKYRMVGNAVTVSVIQWIAQRLQRAAA